MNKELKKSKAKAKENIEKLFDYLGFDEKKCKETFGSETFLKDILNKIEIADDFKEYKIPLMEGCKGETLQEDLKRHSFDSNDSGELVTLDHNQVLSLKRDNRDTDENRPLKTPLINSLKEDFRIEKTNRNPIIVRKFEDGDLVIMDGFHRAFAIRSLIKEFPDDISIQSQYKMKARIYDEKIYDIVRDKCKTVIIEKINQNKKSNE